VNYGNLVLWVLLVLASADRQGLEGGQRSKHGAAYPGRVALVGGGHELKVFLGDFFVLLGVLYEQVLLDSVLEAFQQRAASTENDI